MPTDREVIVTGYGAVTPYGIGVSRLINGLREGRDCIRSMADRWSDPAAGTICRLAAPVPDDVDLSSVPRKHRRSMGRDAMLAHIAAGEALAMAGLPEEMRGTGRTAVVLGSTMASPSSLEEFFHSYLVARDINRIPSNGFFRVMSNSPAANLAAALGVRGPSIAAPAACATGAYSIGLAFQMIRAGLIDAAICGGVEEVHPTTSAIFDLVGAASTHFNDDPSRAPAPFDVRRDGTVCGEGAGAFVIEAAECAQARGAVARARLLGFGGMSDGGTMAQPEVDAMVECFGRALDDARLAASAVGYVNVHATGTVQGDAAESAAVAQVFGADVPVSGLKGYLGHTLGASGAVESIAAVEMMRGGYILPTGKLVEVDPQCAGVRHVLALTDARFDVFAKSSFGFGGINAVMLFGRA